jgi:hypothetical protein
VTRKKKSRQAREARPKADCRFACSRMEKVMQALDLVSHGARQQENPLEEQLRRCPEAFKAGELVGKVCDQLKYDHGETASERSLPPAGSVMPPLV